MWLLVLCELYQQPQECDITAAITKPPVHQSTVKDAGQVLSNI
jgi:hypothetical protein